MEKAHPAAVPRPKVVAIAMVTAPLVEVDMAVEGLEASVVPVPTTVLPSTAPRMAAQDVAATTVDEVALDPGAVVASAQPSTPSPSQAPS
jgi:hypothetical protein